MKCLHRIKLVISNNSYDLQKNQLIFTTLILCISHFMQQKIRFNPFTEVHILRTWRFAYQEARRSKWEQIGRDHARFQDRIVRLANTLNPILADDHRKRVLQRMKATNTNHCSQQV